MPQIIAEKQVKARKKHICDLCVQLIPNGETYVSQFTKWGGDVYTFRSHLVCDEISDYLWDYMGGYDGISADGFIDTCQDYRDTFVCPHCEFYDVDGDCGRDAPNDSLCKDRILDRLRKYRLNHNRKGNGVYSWVEGVEVTE